MNRLLLAALLILLATGTYAQSPIEVTTKDGRAVILKPDGTWEFKKASPEPSATPAVTALNSSGLTDFLPLNFLGHDKRILYNRLLDLKQRLVKSEFETTAQYAKRSGEERAKPILENLTISDTFSLVVSGVRADYDADSQKMRFFLPIEKSRIAHLHLYAKETARNLFDVNAYRIQLDERVGDEQGIYFDDVSDVVKAEGGFSAVVNLGAEEARRSKSTIRAAVLVRFEEPYAAGYEYDRHFQVRLVEVLFFDPQTGKILARKSQLPELGKIRELYQQGRDDEAMTVLLRLLIIEPTNAEAFLLRGKISQRRGDQEAAIAALKTAIFWDRNIVEAHVLLGRIFIIRRDRTEALKYLHSALALDRDNQEAKVLLGTLENRKP